MSAPPSTTASATWAVRFLMTVLLWSHGYYAAVPNNRTNEKWDVVQTFDSAEAGCEVAAAWFREHDSGPLAATRRVRVEYVCLPDSVDPRRPKGK
jgi:hypothetical protein